MRYAKHIIGMPVFQGDVCLLPVSEVPATALPIHADKGRFTITHSESGHDHIVQERPTIRMFQDKMDQFRAWLVIEGEPAELEHLRSHDTHEAISFAPGIWEVRRQTEYSPAGWRAAQD